VGVPSRAGDTLGTGRRPFPQTGVPGQRDVTATLMRYPAGRWPAGLAGLVVVIAGLMLAAEGMSRRFVKYLRQVGIQIRRSIRATSVRRQVAVSNWCWRCSRAGLFARRRAERPRRGREATAALSVNCV